MKYFFTVFVPTYNRKHTLPRLLESLERQTFQDFELIVVDDGSRDGTYDFLKDYSRKVTFPMKVVYQENSGKHVARNYALDMAEGYLFVTIDSDDMLVDKALERFKYWWDWAAENASCYEKIIGVEGLCALLNKGTMECKCRG